MNTAALLGVPRIALRFERLARTRAPARLTVDARPVGSCAASASTGVMRHHRRPKRKRRWRSESDYRIYVGIDWASEAHQACVLHHERGIVAERSFAHDGKAIVEFAQWLSGLTDDPGQVAIAIEIPRGAVVETLVERGFHVYAINPKQLDRFRDRYSVGGAKDDRRAAFGLAAAPRPHQPRLCRGEVDD